MLSVFISLLPLLLSVCSAAPTGNQKPNILFLMVDEMDGRVMDGESPHFRPPMPALWKLAESGAHFPIAYSNAPQCVPARTSMMAGRHNSQMQVWDNFLGVVSVNGDRSTVDSHCTQSYSKEECLDFAQKQDVNGTFIDVLANNGYNVTLYGKMHVGGGLDQYQGSIQEFPFNHGSSKAAMEWSRATGITPVQEVPNWNVPDDVKAPATAPDYMTVDQCSQLLRGGLFRLPTPQFLYCSIVVPHPPYRTNSTYLDKLPPLGNQSVPNFRQDSDVHPSDEYTMKVKQSWLAPKTDVSNVEHFRRVYFSMCIEANELIGRVLDSLAAGGNVDNTYVVFISDHGEHAIENRQTGKNSMLEAASRVPFIITGPGISPGQEFRNDFASLNDVYPTVLDMAGLTDRGISNFVGESLLPLAKGITKSRNRSYIVSEYHSVYSGTGIFMIREKDLKLVLFAPVRDITWPPQLFNLTADPWEHHNIAQDNIPEVTRLGALLEAEYNNITRADSLKKAWEKDMFSNYWYDKNGKAKGCKAAMKKVYKGFDPAKDAQKVADWLGLPCQ